MVGGLPYSGIGEPGEEAALKDVEALRRSCYARNGTLLAALREDAHSTELLENTLNDAKRGRLSQPRPIDECDLDAVLLHPRFGVVQERCDGSNKLRAIDHFSCAAGKSFEHSVNGFTGVSEKMTHDTIDDLAAAMTRFFHVVGEVPGLFKADVDSAFRRIPVRADQRWACGIAFTVGWQVRRRGDVCDPRSPFVGGSFLHSCGLPVRGDRIGACVGTAGSGHRTCSTRVPQVADPAIRGRLLRSRSVRAAGCVWQLVRLRFAGKVSWVKQRAVLRGWCG